MWAWVKHLKWLGHLPLEDALWQGKRIMEWARYLMSPPSKTASVQLRHILVQAKHWNHFPLAAVFLVGLWGRVLIFLFPSGLTHCSTCLSSLLLLPLCYVANGFGEVGHYSFPKDLHILGGLWICMLHSSSPWRLAREVALGNPIWENSPRQQGLYHPQCVSRPSSISHVF